MAKPILLTHWRAPGDITCMTACVRDLALSYPGEYEIHIAGSCQSLWDGNPHIAKSWGTKMPRHIPSFRLSYFEYLKKSAHCRLHFLTAFHRDLSRQIDVPIPALYPQGDLYLSQWHRENRPIPGDYWFLVAGGKDDIQTKIWSAVGFQQVVDLLAIEGISVVQGGAVVPGHQHPALSGVIDFVGKTSLRDVLWLIYHADGIIAPVTFAMHVAAAFEKPCVVLAGNREPWWWEAYTNSDERHFGADCQPVRTPHQFLQATGMFECCHEAGCWKSKLSPHHGKTDNAVCLNRVADDQGQIIPACLEAITPQTVVASVLSYAGSITRSISPRRAASNRKKSINSVHSRVMDDS